MVAEELGIGTEKVFASYSLRGFGKTKALLQTRTHLLTTERMEMRLGACRDLVDIAWREKFPEQHRHRR
ncbi:hypothetical protein TNCV_1915541 [Trichonephila clavipes]|uniref:Uncharacterized protein n=1 Tax=Trichonephila clavipes TaxID=2585209 RepID=A0A8X7BCN3_TRICX|nr:hypothetical protein TNCV_1915541 [Trichonephila clavipes]